MIQGIGTDVVQIDRMEKSLSSPAFWRRVFGPQERQWLAQLAPSRQKQSAAANFAAKEAFLKAIGTGIGGFELGEIQVLRQPSGAPCFALLGQAAQWAQEQKVQAHLSLAHDGGIAQAFVILERQD